MLLTSCDVLPKFGSSAPKVVEEISFNEHIRPILNANCLGCHGGVTKQGGISYIFREEALGRGKSGRRNVVPGDPAGSELIARISSDDPHMRMPLDRPPLSEREIALLSQWIDEGAEWEEHWAFVPPQAAPVPSGLEHQDWVRSPIDAFVLKQMEANGLAPSPEASKLEWLRRASLDLTGLPPSLEVIERFLADESDKAYEEAVDAMLASPTYGERWASVWLDLARYADSKGYANDKHRDAWPYRDWVIGALNDNIGFDDFVIKQLAGDLLPNPTDDDLIATAFHRMTPTNDEGGTEDEEFRLAAVMDRSATTWQALNGMTMHCVQCHSHPYDPILHEEYFESLAFFNTSRDVDWKDDYPNMPVATDPSRRDAVWQVYVAHEQAKNRLIGRTEQWASQWPWQRLSINTATHDPLQGARQVLDIMEAEWDKLTPRQRLGGQWCLARQQARAEGKPLPPAPNSTIKAESCGRPFGRFATRLKRLVQARTNVDELLAEGDISRDLGITDGILRTSDAELDAVTIIQAQAPIKAQANEKLRAVKLTVIPQDRQTASHDPLRGFSIDKLRVAIVRESGDRIAVPMAATAPTNLWGLEQQLGAMRAGDTAPSLPGFAAHTVFQPVALVGLVESPVPLASGDRIEISLDHLQRAQRDLQPYYLTSLAIDISMQADAAKASATYRDSFADLARQRETLSAFDTVALPIMGEQRPQGRRAMVVFNRGNALDRSDTFVSPAVPAALPDLEISNPESEATRLDLAKWFFADDHPLTARTAVNRYWEQLFGRGLVVTLEDFGSSGLPPSHPQLLDYLALRFQNDLGWDAKAMLKEIVLSSTYRQTAKRDPQSVDDDPDNIWLSSGPRQRLTAEMVRDQALAASGLLSRKIGGPPVMPYQPVGVWDVVGDRNGWQTSPGEDRYRRAVYTYIRRGAPYPSFDTFDDVGHTVIAPRRMATNTPLQALVTLNDPVYSEAAKALGQHMARARRGQDFAAAIRHGYLRTATREPTPAELEIFRTAWTKAKANGESDTEGWTAMGSVMLNLDASLVR